MNRRMRSGRVRGATSVSSILGLVFGCQAATRGDESGHEVATIHGVVLDEHTRAPLSGATVTLTTPSAEAGPAADLPTAESIRTLISLVSGDVAAQGVDVTREAAERLAALDWPRLDGALATAALNPLIAALFADDETGRTLEAACAALNAIGEMAEPVVLAAIDGANEPVNRALATMGVERWRVVDSPELLLVLWDLGSPRAALLSLRGMAPSLADPLPHVLPYGDRRCTMA